MSRLVPAPDALVGKRFDVAVAKMLGISRAKAADLIETGQARVLGRDIAKSSSLQAGRPLNSISSRNVPSRNRSLMTWPWSTKTMTWSWSTSR